MNIDEQQIKDGINYNQWKEWAGEIVTLSREDSRWVWEQLQKLEQKKEEISQLMNGKTIGSLHHRIVTLEVELDKRKNEIQKEANNN